MHASQVTEFSGKPAALVSLTRETLATSGTLRSALGTMKPTKSTSFFTRFAKWTSRAAGRPAAFAIAMGALLLWAVSGPFFGFSDTWQLVINTGTTIVTFLMVFLIQNTQNRDSEAIQVKLDELIRSHKSAHNALLDLEELEEEELDRIRESYEQLAERARGELGRRKPAAKDKQERKKE
jgi:low affinity Fe/Cu permease